MLIDQVSAQIQSAQVEGLGELLAIIDKEFGLKFVAGGNPSIVAGLTLTLAQHEATGCCPSPTDLPGLFRDFESGAIHHPISLVGEEEVWRWDDFGFHISGPTTATRCAGDRLGSAAYFKEGSGPRSFF
jgi:hypothetical protein